MTDHDQMTDQALAAKIEEALLAMPDHRRQIYLAVRFDDLSYADIARITGLSTRGVERELARAISDIGRHVAGLPPRRSWLQRWLGWR